jgi:hypothetical protein
MASLITQERHLLRNIDVMTESPKSERDMHATREHTWTNEVEIPERPTESSTEITLDLVARTAFELRKVLPHDAETDLEDFYSLGPKAIELLYIWKRQLEIEKTNGAAAKSVEELVSRWQTELEEIHEKEEDRRKLEDRSLEIQTISCSIQIPFPEAAKRVLPKNRNRTIWLQRTLTPVAHEKENPLSLVAAKALRERAVPVDFIPILQKWLPYCRKSYKSWLARKKGKKGGVRRAENQAKKTASQNHRGKNR